jgi:hypothetical protein
MLTTRRDNALKNEIGAAEDSLRVLGGEFEALVEQARSEDAEGHAEFYEEVQGQIASAVGCLESAYARLLNGDDELGVMPLEEEATT